MTTPLVLQEERPRTRKEAERYRHGEQDKFFVIVCFFKWLMTDGGHSVGLRSLCKAYDSKGEQGRF